MAPPLRERRRNAQELRACGGVAVGARQRQPAIDRPRGRIEIAEFDFGARHVAQDTPLLRPAAHLLGERQRLLELDKRSEEHTSELQSLMRSSYAVFCLKKK